MFFVRLKPYDKALGNLKCDYIAPWGAKFVAGLWYEVDDPQAAEYLKTIRQRHEDNTSPLAFDVTDHAGARAIIADEKRRKLDHARPVKPPVIEAPREVKTTASVDLNAPEVTHALEVAEPEPESFEFGGDADDEDFGSLSEEPSPVTPVAAEGTSRRKGPTRGAGSKRRGSAKKPTGGK